MIVLPKPKTFESIDKTIWAIEDRLNILAASIEAHRQIFINIDKRLTELEKEIFGYSINDKKSVIKPSFLSEKISVTTADKSNLIELDTEEDNKRLEEQKKIHIKSMC